MNERKVLRGFMANVEMLPPLIITFPFNPTSIKDNKSVTFADNNADLCCNGPGKLYTGAGPRTISFSFKLEGLEQGTNWINPTGLDNGISTELAKLRSFLYPKKDAWADLGTFLGGSKKGTTIKAPPTCYFGFGTRILECQVTDLQIDETMFNSFLAPVRADVSVTLNVMEEGKLYEFDKQHRNVMAMLGLQNVRIY